MDDPEGGVAPVAPVREEGGGEAGEEDGGRRVRARREGERDDRVRQVVVLGPNSIDNFWLEFRLEQLLEFWLEIPYTEKIFKDR